MDVSLALAATAWMATVAFSWSLCVAAAGKPRRRPRRRRTQAF